MTPLRATDLQSFLTSAEAAICHQSGADGRVRLAAKRMFTALQAPSTQAVPHASRFARLPPSGQGVGQCAPSAKLCRRLGRCLCHHRAEIRHDVWIGVSLMAPHMRYPDHRHRPEEIYVVLSDGQWRQASDPWHEPGIGGLVYNPPNVVHAMRSTERPLLALWFLWTDQISS
jgi:gentisate 1,2-dioxygenase